MTLFDMFLFGLAAGFGIGLVQIIADSVRMALGSRRLKNAMKAMDDVKYSIAAAQSDLNTRRH